MEHLMLPEDDAPYVRRPLRNASIAMAVAIAAGALFYFAPLLSLAFIVGVVTGWVTR